MNKELRKKLDELNKRLSEKPLQNDKQIVTLRKPEILKKMQQAKLGTKHDKSTKEKMSLAKKGKKPNNYGKKHSTKRIMPKSVCEKISKTLTGIVHSEESCKRRSQTMKGKPKPKVTCPHCGKEGGKPVMIKSHFDNCKQKGENK
jgi:hypothetical protein